MWLLLRIAINLYYKLYRLLYYPLHLLFKRSFGIILIAGLGYLLIQFFDDDPKHRQQDKKKYESIIQPVKTVEDGNSAFATDLIPKMNPEELRVYSDTFFWVMQHQPKGKAHGWNFYNIYGTITPGPVFNNNLGHQCRRFREVLKVHEIQQTLDGISCKKADGGWCKLGKNWTPICGLGPDGGISGFVNGIENSLRGLFR